ncbi:L-2-amino-thiazoline-4-carboxylic acid hydrolase [Butyrivibrio sp. VCB2001]|uniref:L-2-amino-thiazoline-4-carboxylic acid hydrolase n=1 Tax=Butyrivibrio sp. VCB2001 TaxID=1280667 RepID=UPI0018CADC3A|nr:L-2-amino-thiazoline-4-carboxylic acid hydrolase [Butyrivibrio sp. VCB2001]
MKSEIMNKKYIPRKMIPRSRFRDLYKEWDEEDRALLIDKMNVLLFENSQYTDSKNYGFLCNLLTSLAIVQVLESKGMPRKEAEQYTADAMYKFIEPQIKSMKKLANNGWFVRFLKLTMPMKFRNTLGYGWDVEFPKCGRDEFSMITHKCIFHQIFEKYGMPEMTAIFCKVDDILYSDLPRADFLYSQQIGNGGTMCDYKFRRKKLSV